MRIAISSQGTSTFSIIDQRFGRCKYFIIVDLEENKVIKAKSIENKGAIQGHGAGIKSAQQIAELGIDSVITGQIGPNAFDILNQFSNQSISFRRKDRKINKSLLKWKINGNLRYSKFPFRFN